jgi:hypothetical protein
MLESIHTLPSRSISVHRYRAVSCYTPMVRIWGPRMFLVESGNNLHLNSTAGGWLLLLKGTSTDCIYPRARRGGKSYDTMGRHEFHILSINICTG